MLFKKVQVFIYLIDNKYSKFYFEMKI